MSIIVIVQAAETESDEPDGLPPLEPDEEADEAGFGLDDFLESFPEDADEDDELAAELDVGVSLDGAETEAEPDAEPLEIDLRELVRADEPDLAPEAGDDFGPEAFDPATGLDSDPAGFGDDEPEAAEGDDTPMDAELPPLDADLEGDTETEIGAAELLAPEERSLPRAAAPWHEIEPRLRVEAIGALTVSEGHALAGSGDLLWIHAGSDSALRAAAEENRLTSVCLLGRARDSALCATAGGRLLRRARLGPAVALTQFREAAGLSQGQAASLELCQFGVERANSVLLWLSTGKLLASDDCGTTFRPLDLPGRVLALSATATPAVALCSTRAGVELWTFDERCRGVAQRIPANARAVAEGAAPWIAACDQVVVIADGERGAALSSDGGRTFNALPGCVNATAIAAGMLRGRPSVWIALYRETEDATDIVQIDAATLAPGIVTRIEPRDPAETIDPNETVEQARVQRLVWDATNERLWAAGGFGLLRFGPPH